MTTLIARYPSLEDHDAFLDMIKECEEYGEAVNISSWDITHADSFKGYVESLNACRHNEPPLAAHVYWVFNQEELVGRLLLRHHKEDEVVKAEGNLGYFIRPSRRNMGLGSETLMIGLRKAKELALTPLLAINHENAPSLRVAEKCGFQEVLQHEGVIFLKRTPYVFHA